MFIIVHPKKDYRNWVWENLSDFFFIILDIIHMCTLINKCNVLHLNVNDVLLWRRNERLTYKILVSMKGTCIPSTDEGYFYNSNKAHYYLLFLKESVSWFSRLTCYIFCLAVTLYGIDICRKCRKWGWNWNMKKIIEVLTNL